MLPSTGFFSGASDALADAFQRLARPMTLSKGETLFEEGVEGDALYAVEKGALEISVLSMDGRKLTLDVLRRGAILGEIALFDPGPRSATAIALEETGLLRVQNGDLMREITRDPSLAVDITQLAGRRMRAMNQQFSDQVFLPMPARLARKVLYLSAQAGTPEKLSMSQSELAEFMGATREAVSKTIGDWKRAGYVIPGRGGLTICDRDALSEIAEADLD